MPCWQEKSGSFFFSAEGAWGSIRYVRQGKEARVRIEVEEGQLEVAEVMWGGVKPLKSCLAQPGMAQAGQPLTVVLS